MKKYIFGAGILASLLFGACNSGTQKNNDYLRNGKWRGEFTVKDGTIPFIFDIKDTHLTLINGEEEVVSDSIAYKGDSIFIPIKAYDTRFEGTFSGDTLQGVFRKLFAENDPGIPFKAIHGEAPRFQKEGISQDTISGKWDIQFLTDSTTANNVGIFKQDNSILTGSILTNSGDFRYLEGIIDQNGFKLSAFAGLSPYLIQGTFTDKDNFEGEFITARGKQKIVGKRNDKAALANPYSLTQLKKGAKSLGFKLPDLKGNTVSLSDEKFKGKVVVVSILGSWCPNCLDEAAFLAPWYKENKDRGVEIVGLAFERKDDPAYVNKVLSNFIQKYNIGYDVLFAGKIGNDKNVLPEIDGLKSYPTTFFIDKKGNVRKIHTGFNGPATGLFYEEFKSDFNKIIDELLAEK